VRKPQSRPRPTPYVSALAAHIAEAKESKDPRALLWGTFDQEAKNALRKHLAEEQRWTCAYCERRLASDLTRTVIEHFHPRNGPKGRSFDPVCSARIDLPRAKWDQLDVWLGNLLLTCDGTSGGDGSRLTCDASKAGTDICEKFYNPRRSAAPTLVAVSPDGALHAKDGPGSLDEAQYVLDQVLNLNSMTLKIARSAIYVARVGTFRKLADNSGGKIPRQDLRNSIAERFRSEAEASEFGSTILSAAETIQVGAKRRS